LLSLIYQLLQPLPLVLAPIQPAPEVLHLVAQSLDQRAIRV